MPIELEFRWSVMLRYGSILFFLLFVNTGCLILDEYDRVRKELVHHQCQLREGRDCATLNIARGLWLNHTDLYITTHFRVFRLNLITHELNSWAGQMAPIFSEKSPNTIYFNKLIGIAQIENLLYVVDAKNYRIHQISLSGEISTIAGSGEQGFQDGNGSQAMFWEPSQMTTDGQYLYIIDGNSIRKIDPNTQEVSTLAGRKQPGDQDGISAKFDDPHDLTYYQGFLYISDTDNHKIKQLDLKTQEVTSLQTRKVGTTLSSKWKLTGLNRPKAIAATEQKLFVFDRTELKQIDLNTLEVSLFAGKNSGYQDGKGEQAEFNLPIDLIAGDRKLLMIDSIRNHFIRQINLWDQNVYTHSVEKN